MDDWAVEQQRLHNLATYQRQLRPVGDPPRPEFDTFEVFLRVYDSLTPYQQSGWNTARPKFRESRA